MVSADDVIFTWTLTEQFPGLHVGCHRTATRGYGGSPKPDFVSWNGTWGSEAHVAARCPTLRARSRTG